MTISKESYFESAKFLKAKDVKSGTIFTIDKFEEIKTRLGTRPCLRLKGVDMPFGLNATNLDTLIEKFGDNELKYPGKRIKLMVVATTNPSDGGKATKGLRIE